MCVSPYKKVEQFSNLRFLILLWICCVAKDGYVKHNLKRMIGTYRNHLKRKGVLIDCQKFHSSFTQKTKILLMEEILHQLIWSNSQYLQSFMHVRWLARFLPSTVPRLLGSRQPSSIFNYTHNGAPRDIRLVRLQLPDFTARKFRSHDLLPVDGSERNSEKKTVEGKVVDWNPIIYDGFYTKGIFWVSMGIQV